jgi:O-antigen/teichoic acid export membrane protein
LAVYGLTKPGGVFLALLIGLSVFRALIVNVAGTAGALVYLASQMSLRTFRPSFTHTRLILQLAFPVGLLLLALQILTNIDLWSLKIIGTEGAEVIGMYVAALNIARVPALAFSAVNGVILPSLSRALALQDMALALFGVAQVCREMVITQDRPYLIAATTLSHIPIAMAFNLTFIPLCGPIGAAMSLALTALLLATITGWQVFRRLGSLLETSTFVKVILATTVTAMVAVHVPLMGVWLPLKYMFLMGSYGLILALLDELTGDDLRLFAPWQAEQA